MEWLRDYCHVGIVYENCAMIRGLEETKFRNDPTGSMQSSRYPLEYPSSRAALDHECLDVANR